MQGLCRRKQPHVKKKKKNVFLELSHLPRKIEESFSNVGELGLILGSERSPGEGNGIQLQYSCLENSMERRARTATVHGVTESDTTE